VEYQKFNLDNLDVDAFELIKARKSDDSDNSEVLVSVYRDERYYYKVWKEEYLTAIGAISKGAWIPARESSILPGFDCGFYSPENSAALVGFIYSDTVLRGYVTKVGQPLSIYDHNKVEKPELSAFLYKAWLRALSVGWLPCDICFNNLIQVDGVISFIDFDTELTDMAALDLEYEARLGALRLHVFPYLRGLVAGYFSKM
jgi:hypothetical protein